MKQIKYLLRAGSLLIMGLLAQHLNAQSVGGGRNEARFGVDGDVTDDTLYFGTGAPGALNASDDWFVYPTVKRAKGGVGVIDTNGAAYYKFLLQSAAAYRQNLRFTKGMSLPKLSRSGGYVMLDALYARDHQDNDKTTINSTGSVKLIDDPSTWTIQSGSMNNKTDITEFYSHVRRKGLTVNDSLFFYFGVGVYGTSGQKNLVSELFVNDVQFDTVNNVMTNLGMQGGRSAWRLDAAGNVKVIGDMIVSMTYNPASGGSFQLEPQIWMRKSTYDSFTNTTPPLLRPVNFNLGTANWQGTGSGTYGYVHIEPKGGPATVVAQGRANNTGITTAAPWGNTVASGYSWSANYNTNQFIELSINLTRLGVDPATFIGVDPCTIPYRSIIFYSQTSASANSAPEDFAGPYPFWRYPEVPHLLSGDQNVTCANPVVTLRASTPNKLAFYGWDTTGDFVPDVKDTFLNVTRGGTYSMRSSPLEGCWGDTTTVVIYADKVSPVATLTTSTTWWEGTGIDTFDILDGDPSFDFLRLYGGNIPASVTAYNNVAGVGTAIAVVDSSDFTWRLTRYNGGNPLIVNDTTRVTVIYLADYYTFTVNGLRNGCVASQKILITILPVSILNFDCRPDGSGIKLQWTSADEQGLMYYEVQRMEQGKYVSIGRVTAAEDPYSRNAYAFRDMNPRQGWNTYRLAMHMQNGNTEYSNVCMSLLNDNGADFNGLGLVPNPAADAVSFPVQLADENTEIRYSVHNATGMQVMKGQVIPAGNLVQLNVSQLPSGIYMMQVEMNGRVFNEKLVINR